MNELYIDNLKSIFIAILIVCLCHGSFAQIVEVGDGSYITEFPGVDEAGRNTFPSGTPYTTGIAATKPVPTNDWWSAQIKNSHASNLFNYPYTLKTVNEGLVVTYIPWGVIDDIQPVIVGVAGLNASAANVSDFSDWTVTMDWSNADHNFQATAGIGMPFLYFEKNTADIAQVIINEGSVAIQDEVLIITDARNGADFAVYAPNGSNWTQNSNTYTSNLNGENYWSMAFIPLDASDVNSIANEYKKYAYVFPVNTTADWSYNTTNSIVRTDFVVETEVKEGEDTTMLLGMLPHQWAKLASNSAIPNQYSYQTVRGELKTLDGNTFSVENKFHGILPTLPYLDNYSEGFNPQDINDKVQLLENDGLATWTDSYNEGQMMNRLIQTARIAHLIGNNTARDKIISTVKTRLENWLSANSSEVAFLFYYIDTWSAMIGYPAGHGQDGNLNDHHFHWGYFIHAASFIEQFEPGWADQYGEMINLLIRDAASFNRNDDMFPFLRNFSPYAGHCWANGFASFPQGNDQESTSESMQFNSSLIHWGTITGNDEIRDLGIYLYTTEQSAIEEYWFDMYNRNFSESQQYSLVSRVWGNSYDNGTFWTNDIAASYGIEMYPIHGGSLYLGHNLDYVDQLWAEIEQNTGILNNEVNDNLWHDIMWEYLAFTNPEQAIELYDSYPDRSLKFGVSDAQTYHWLHAMNVLGNIDTSVTADYPIAAVFNNEGENIYTAHNYTNDSLTVTFSDAYILELSPGSMKTSKDISLSGVLTSSFSEAYPGGSVELSVIVNGGTADKIEFYVGENMIGEITQAPYVYNATNLFAGKHSLYAKIYEGENFNVSNLISIVVGEQLPYLGYATEIPGSMQAGNYDMFEGGIGQGIAYNDVSPGNAGDYRPGEYVDASMDFSEGAVVGWISSGEWLEYTIDVQQAGYYSLDFRYACGNQNGGGPFHLESDGNAIFSDITVNYTGDWGDWATGTVSNIPLKSGRQVLKLYFENGELNFGNMTFSYESPLSYNQPVADAGENILVLLPENSTMLDGSNSIDPDGVGLSYSWSQIYGPSVIDFSSTEVSQPAISSLLDGVYLLKLQISNGSYSDEDQVYVICSNNSNVAPKVSIVTPLNNSEYIENKPIVFLASASDLIGYVEKVEFYVNSQLIETSTESPYQTAWITEEGPHSLTAIAYDNDGASTVSQSVNVIVTPAPPCRNTSSNGEFDYEFSADDNNPTITFIPSISGMGNPTCILYYGTNANSLPGYGVTPNVPYQINASEGTTVYFYYTYSYPGQGEHNNADQKDTYVVGSCESSTVNVISKDLSIKYYPNPVTNNLHIELPGGENEIYVYSLTGKMLDEFSVLNKFFNYNMSEYQSGIYIFKVINNHNLRVFKVIK